jgi:threonine/homoserine/homoserine lactone efflux protein
VIGAFLAGALAGLAIAVPVGAIAVIIVYQSVQHGFRTGASAGLGAATADGLYATVAVALGALVAPLIHAVELPLRIASVAVLLVLAVMMLRPLWARPVDEPAGAAVPGSPLRAYLTVLGLTIANPATIVYFAALVAGNTLGTDPTIGDRVAFVVGAFVGSGAWQTLLAGAGATFRKALAGPTARKVSAVVGALLVCGLAVKAGLGW